MTSSTDAPPALPIDPDAILSPTISAPAAPPAPVAPLVTEAELARAQELRSHALAAETRRSYESAWRRFAEWCDAKDTPALPAHPRAVELFLDQVRTPEGAVPVTGTLNVYRAAIAYVHRQARMPSPLVDPGVEDAWKALRRERGTDTHGAAALTIDHLERIIPRLPKTPEGLRDRALLLVGVAGAFRASELLGLQIKSVTFEGEGALIALERRKTSQTARTVVGIGASGDPILCPVAALRTWMETLRTMGIRNFRIPLGGNSSLWRGFSPTGAIGAAPLGRDGLTAVIRRAVGLIGLDPEGFSPHSLRVGFVTSADAAGLTVPQIAEQTGHKSPAMVLHYTRHARALRESPTAALFRGDRKR